MSKIKATGHRHLLTCHF